MATMVGTIGAQRHEGIGAIATAAATAADVSVAKNLLLFFAAPFIGLAYIIAAPFIGVAVLVKVGVRALI